MERKLATVLFADLVGSTELVSDQDPEITRRNVTAFFDAVAGCIETHGGTVEKFAGDAVMAAFGIPQAHEDDAERAVRAALGIIENVHELGVEARIGIEAGEVVVDETDSPFATGSAVNVAARLQQAAGPGEILIGDAAHRLTEGRVEAEDVGPLELRGFRRPIAAYRALAAVDGRPQSATVSAPFVGRESELDLLENTLARTIRDRRPHVFTIYGEPGVGKSRLLREFLAGVEGATVLAGRALPYGEGVTYWPLAEMVKSAAGITDDDPMETAREKLLECCGEEAIAELLGLASGVLESVEGERGQPEIAWAAREFVDELASVQPLILVFEDIHWAEEPLLELIDHLAQWVRERPLVLLCLSRPELLDVRPGWGGGRVRSTSIELEPLGRVFAANALAQLSPDFGDELEDALDDLLVRDLLTRETRSSFSGEIAYRFKHVLIREVAYAALSKSSRAEYHQQFAEWLSERADKELLEIRAYHLDQACLLLAELDGRAPLELAQTAAHVLEVAGKRALSREANQSARKLLLRAVELEPTLERRYNAARAAWKLAEFDAVKTEMSALVKDASRDGNNRIQGRALTALSDVTLSREGDVTHARELADQALALLDEDDFEGRFGALDVRSLADCWE